MCLKVKKTTTTQCFFPSRFSLIITSSAFLSMGERMRAVRYPIALACPMGNTMAIGGPNWHWCGTVWQHCWCSAVSLSGLAALFPTDFHYVLWFWGAFWKHSYTVAPVVWLHPICVKGALQKHQAGGSFLQNPLLLSSGKMLVARTWSLSSN